MCGSSNAAVLDDSHCAPHATLDSSDSDTGGNFVSSCLPASFIGYLLLSIVSLLSRVTTGFSRERKKHSGATHLMQI